MPLRVIKDFLVAVPFKHFRHVSFKVYRSKSHIVSANVIFIDHNIFKIYKINSIFVIEKSEYSNNAKLKEFKGLLKFNECL